MRQKLFVFTCLAGALFLSACANEDADVERALETVNAIDDNNLGNLMLNSSNPGEAVAYFRRTVAEKPERLDLKRGLAIALVRNKQMTEATTVWAEVTAHPDAVNTDHIGYAETLIRVGNFEAAGVALGRIPPTYETYDRYRLEAIVADSRQEWKKADSFYEVALGLTTQPAGVLNNWGFSKLTRNDFKGAERLFAEALTYRPDMFTAKNNLVLARGSQRNYQLPIVRMTQIERAQLLHTMGLAAIKQGDVEIGKGLLQEAIESHPRHFEAAVRSLRALDDTIVR